ncbi:MAG: hypothetical protein P1U68_11060 [Verrucomicrobiales bacterium]|nr:hypothetical protein [Verrucomicrobiales bacterium]
MLLRLALICLLIGSSSRLHAWTLLSGETIEGKPVAFQFEEKVLVFENPLVEGPIEIQSKDLSLRDRQRLLISPLFYKSFPGNPAWPREKRNLLLFAVFSPVAALLIGFWIAGILVARKISPIRALCGFCGGWILGILFFSLYLYFSSKIGGGITTVLFGSGMGLMILSFYISAIYSCNIFKGLLIFLLQLFIGTALSLSFIFAGDLMFDQHNVERFWNEKVFAPVGLIDDPNPFHSVKSDSSQARYSGIASLFSSGAQTAKTLSVSS